MSTGRLVRTKGGTKFKRFKKKIFGGHDWHKFPEVSINSPLFAESPHVQIVEDIDVRVIRVKDADTIQVRWDKRKFDFPVRLIDVYAPEKNTWDGRRARTWLSHLIKGQNVTLKINYYRRIGKWGRLLAEIIFDGRNINQEIIAQGFAITPEEQARLSK